MADSGSPLRGLPSRPVRARRWCHAPPPPHLPGDRLSAQVLVDAAHLWACAGRCLGLGARRGAPLDPERLLHEILALLPEEDRNSPVLWLDGFLSQEQPRTPPGRASVRLVPVHGSRQRGAEVLVALETLRAAEQGITRLYLVGDPIRHREARALAVSAGVHVQDIGIAYGEPTQLPARWWIRRPELEACLQSQEPRLRRVVTYRPPRLRQAH